ncbi:MAG TPA: flagellar FliJ family protein [Lacipirellulaceae bacterium]|jgi:flagellar FliJ protein|nr:flagellar FliJ family protein [Lacipirellulaceae bacterium]
MAKYKFRLETLQRVREARRDEQRASLADAFRAEQILAESRAELVVENEALRELQRTATAGKYLNVNQLLEAQRYELLLKARGQELTKQAILLAAETERRRQILVEADREVRVLEMLDDRHQDAFKLKQQRLETKRADEIATNRWGRTRDNI